MIGQAGVQPYYGITGYNSVLWNGWAFDKIIGNITPQQYGAKANGIADDTVAIQAAGDAARANGSKKGRVFFPDGIYNYTSLDFNNSNNLMFEGTRNNFGSNPLGAELRCVSDGAHRINFTESIGVTLRNLALTYNNPAFGSYLVDFSGTSSRNSAHIVLEGCSLFGRDGARSAYSLLLFDRANMITLRDCYLLNADRAVLGSLNNSNSVKMDGCHFIDINVSPIVDAGEAWSVLGCTFNSLYNLGAVGAAGAYSHTPAGIYTKGMSWRGCWFGDIADPNTGTWIKFSGMGLDFKGNHISLAEGATGIELDDTSFQGIDIASNYLYKVGVGAAPVFLKITGAGGGAIRLGPNYNGAAGAINEFTGTLPEGSVYIRSNYIGGGRTGLRLPSFANNAAAVAGGLISGELYCETGSDPLRVAKVI